MLNKVQISDLNTPPPCEDPEALYCPDHILPDGSISFTKIENNKSSHSFSLHYSMRVNDNRNSKYHRPNNFTRLGSISFPEALPGIYAILFSFINSR